VVNEEGEEVEQDSGVVGNLPDLMSDSKLWQWANISFGEYNVMLL
jgi:hypothetical protein